MNKQKFEYKRTLKLPAALGDWTKLKFSDPALQNVHISSVGEINFDSLSKADLKEAHKIHYTLSQAIIGRLSKDMNIKIELHSIDATQLSYGNFIEAQTANVVQAKLELSPFGFANVVMDWQLADMMVNRLTGGPGVVSGAESFSDIESSILEAQFSTVLGLLSKQWGEGIHLDTANHRLFYGPFVQDRNITLREAYVVFNIVMFFGKGEKHTLAFAYPNSIIRALLAHFRANRPAVAPTSLLSKKTRQRIKIDAKVQLGKGSLTMGQLKTLKKGDIISLESLITEPLFLTIPHKIHIAAQPGVQNGKLAVQLFEWTPAEESDHPHFEEALLSRDDEDDDDDQTLSAVSNRSIFNPMTAAAGVAAVQVATSPVKTPAINTEADDMDDMSDDESDNQSQPQVTPSQSAISNPVSPAYNQPPAIPQTNQADDELEDEQAQHNAYDPTDDTDHQETAQSEDDHEDHNESDEAPLDDSHDDVSDALPQETFAAHTSDANDDAQDEHDDDDDDDDHDQLEDFNFDDEEHEEPKQPVTAATPSASTPAAASAQPASAAPATDDDDDDDFSWDDLDDEF